MPGCETNYFKVNRKIFESDIWLHPDKLRIFIYLLGQARWKSEPNTKYKKFGITIERGQYLRSLRKMQGDLEYYYNNALKEYSLSTLSRIVSQLEEEERITTDKTELGTLFTICNYDKYQKDSSNGKELGTDLEQARNTVGTHLEQYSKKGNKDERRMKEIDKYADEISAVYNHWIDLLSDINNARLTERQKKAILTKIKKWSVDEIKQAITNYNEIYRADFYYSHNFTMYKFIKTKRGIPRFIAGLDEEFDGDIWKDYNDKCSTGTSKVTDSVVC